MGRIFSALTVLAALSLLLPACGTKPAAKLVQSNERRIISPNVPADDIQEVVNGNNDFALDLYRSLSSQDGNLTLSPYSISLALAMTYAGGRGETETQMANVLHFMLPQEQLHPAFDQLDLNLTQQGKAASKDEQPLQLDIANAVWAEQTFTFLQDYLDLIAHNYGAGIQLADFANQTESTRQDINNWVSDQTHKRIKELIPANALDASTKMVLVNAIYFKANWQEPFDPSDTSEAPFHFLDGSQAQTKMMSNDLSGAPYVAGNGYQAIELAYQGDTAAMDIIVPDQGAFDQFESQFEAQKYEEIINSLHPTSVALSLPKFNFDAKFELKDRLSTLGMPDAFDPELADFSGMTGRRDLFISAVLHQAFVAVDEKGTEAAAATGVIMAPTSARLADVTLTVDRPFVFIIRDVASGQILFIGRVLNPAT